MLVGGAILVAVNPPVVETLTHNSVWFRVSLELQAMGRHLY
jgi:hypothetical protein